MAVPEVLKTGVLTLAGGALALVVIVAVGFGARLAYTLMTSDREHLALMSGVEAACSDDGADFRTISGLTDAPDAQIVLAAHKDALAACTTAKLRLFRYELRQTY